MLLITRRRLAQGFVHTTHHAIQCHRSLAEHRPVNRRACYARSKKLRRARRRNRRCHNHRRACSRDTAYSISPKVLAGPCTATSISPTPPAGFTDVRFVSRFSNRANPHDQIESRGIAEVTPARAKPLRGREWNRSAKIICRRPRAGSPRRRIARSPHEACGHRTARGGVDAQCHHRQQARVAYVVVVSSHPVGLISGQQLRAVHTPIGDGWSPPGGGRARPGRCGPGD